MKRLLCLTLVFVATLIACAKDFAWRCAIEWTEKKPEWIFVYEDIKQLSDGCFRIFTKWEFTDDPNKSSAKQTWFISPDFDKVVVVKSVGYNKEDEIVYSEDYPYGMNWSYVMPDTYSEAVVNTVIEILLTD